MFLPFKNFEITAVICAAVLLIVQQGCASKPIKSPPVADPSWSQQKIAVVIKKTMSEEALKTPGKGVATSIGRGAGTGAARGASAGVLCQWGAILCVPVGLVLGTVGGAAIGGIASEKSSTWDEAESIFRTNLTELNFEYALAEKLVAFAKENGYALHFPKEPTSSHVTPVDYEKLSSEGIDLVLELSNVTVELRPESMSSGPVNPRRSLFVSVRGRLMRTAGEAVLDDRTMIDDEMNFHSLDEWKGDNGLMFRKQVILSAQRMSETIAMELFYPHTFTERQFSSNLLFILYVVGLKPVYPPVDNIKELGYVDSLQPRLAWEPLPGNNVSYDMKIWRSQDGYNPAELVYSRESVPGSFHTVETPLMPGTIYLWTVRARYKVASQTRITPWSTCSKKVNPLYGVMSFGTAYIFPMQVPESKYFRFTTPKKF